MPHLNNHLLYYKKSCPFCHKVLNFMEDNKVSMELRDIEQQEHRAALEHIGGKKQVPCLVVNDNALYESDDIIAYIRSEVL